jgi:hypothetical protein
MIMKNLSFKLTFFCPFILISLILYAHSLFGQVSVDTTMTVEQLVNDVLLGEGIEATNITFNGEPADQVNYQVGRFEVASSAFPIAEGVVISTGTVMGIAGGIDFSGNNTYQDDPDLVAISGETMNNCAVIEFDFVASTDTFLIDYVFASTEYPGFTCTIFNDAFGIFLSGPGISGPFTNNAENIALIPNSNIPVSINAVNGGAPTGGGDEQLCLDANPNYVSDSIYFFDNIPTLENSIDYPGHTHIFTAFASVLEGETYHFKFAIGNAFDQALNSAVMIRSGSIVSEEDQNQLQLEVNTEDVNVGPEGVFVGGTFNYFVPEPMVQVAENVYRFTTNVSPFVNVTYKFFLTDEIPNSGELVPQECSIFGAMTNGDRYLTMPDNDLIVETTCFGTCEVCEGVLSADSESGARNLKVFPNPAADGVFHLPSPESGMARLQIFDIQGKLVNDQRIYTEKGQPVPIEINKSGLFNVRLLYDDRTNIIYSSTVVVN